MKRALMLVCLAGLMAAPAMAAGTQKKGVVQQVSGQGYGMAGCGLGSILFGEQPGMIQIVAATFNGTAGSQTFGITSGTSNCTDGGSHGDHAALFITANREALEKDIARGNGETIDSLSQIMGCSSAQQLGSTLQHNYRSIFPSQKAPTDGVVDSIMNTVKSDSQLSHSCSSIG
jgi:hypothetical protein